MPSVALLLLVTTAAAAVDVDPEAEQQHFPKFGGARRVQSLDSASAWKMGFVEDFGDATRPLSAAALSAIATSEAVAVPGVSLPSAKLHVPLGRHSAIALAPQQKKDIWFRGLFACDPFALLTRGFFHLAPEDGIPQESSTPPPARLLVGPPMDMLPDLHREQNKLKRSKLGAEIESNKKLCCKLYNVNSGSAHQCGGVRDNV